MKITYKLYFLIFFLLLLSCNKTKTNDSHSEFMTIPEKVKQNQFIEIVLKNSELRNENLYARVDCYNEYGSPSRYRLYFKKKGDLFKVKFHVPGNSAFLIIDYEKKNELNKFKPIFRIVYKNDKPSLIGSVFALRISKKLEEILHKHQSNEKLFPYNKLSWAMVCYIKNKFFGIELSTNEIDSVYRIIQQNMIKTSLEDLFDNYSACFSGYCLVKNWEKAEFILHKLKNSEFKNIQPSYLAVDNIVNFLRENSIKSLMTNEAIRINKNTNKIFRSLHSWPKINNTIFFINKSLKRLDSIAANNFVMDDFLNVASNVLLKIDSSDYIYYYTDFFYLTKILKWRKEYSKAISVGLKGKEIIKKLLTVDLWDTTKTIEGLLTPADGVYGGLLLEIAGSAELNNNDSLAISIYKELINYKKNNNSISYIDGARSLASIYLTELYIKLNQFENATLSLKKAYEFKSPYAERTHSNLKKELKKSGRNPLMFDEFLKDVIDTLYPPPPDLVIKQKTHKYNLKDSNGVLTFCFFLSPSCTSCNAPVFDAIDIINSYTEIKKNILVVANKEQLQFLKGYDNVITIERNQKLLDKFKITDLPTTIVIKEGKIRGRSGNISRNKNSWLYYLGIY